MSRFVCRVVRDVESQLSNTPEQEHLARGFCLGKRNQKIANARLVIFVGALEFFLNIFPCYAAVLFNLFQYVI